MARSPLFQWGREAEAAHYDDTVSEDRLSSNPQLDWEQEGERTGDRISTFLRVRLQAEGSKLEQE